MNEDNESTNKLIERVNAFGREGLDVVCEEVLDDPDFSIRPGSSKPHQHHYGDGGLAEHTCEVVDLCFEVKKYFDKKHEIDSIELFLAALFHDSGKMYDYAFDIKTGMWTSAKHKRMIHHISRSAIIWTEAARLNEHIYRKYHESVLHAILAHHGRREAGSPVAPKSRVAWILHFCDGISARVYDADTLDVVEHYA